MHGVTLSKVQICHHQLQNAGYIVLGYPTLCIYYYCL